MLEHEFTGKQGRNNGKHEETALKETVISFYSKEETLRAKQRAKRLKVLCVILTAAALTGCVLLCVLLKTKTEALYRLLITALSSLASGACVCVYMLGIRPAGAFYTHAEGLEEAEKEEAEGILLPGKEYFSIPKSVAVCRVRLQQSEEQVLRLSVRADKKKLLPAPGTHLKITAARKYILRTEISGEAGASGKEEKQEKAAHRLRGKLRKFLSLLPPLLLCVILSAVMWNWIINLKTDTAPENKLTLYTTASLADRTGLSVLMEDRIKADGAENIRVAQAREFTYFMFGGDALKGGDLFIIKESELTEYADWFAPLPEETRTWPDAAFICGEDGVPLGILIDAPEHPNDLLRQYITGPDESLYLCFGKGSLHLAENGGAADNEAARMAVYLLGTP